MNKTILQACIISSLIAFLCGWALASVMQIPSEIESDLLSINEPESMVCPEALVNNQSELPVLNDLPEETAPKQVDSVAENAIGSECEVLLAQLEEKNVILEQQMLKQETDALLKYAKLQVKLNGVKNLAQGKGIKIESISDKEARQYLPSPFAEVVSSSIGSLAERFKKLHEEDEDYSWAPTMQQNISDFYITHENSYAVRLSSVLCKKTVCEIRGFQDDEKAHSQIMSEMSRQPWWDFKSTHSNTSNSNEYGLYFYTLASK